MPKATLINQAGNRVVVDAGSQQAQQYFGQGYKLMGNTPITSAIPKTLTSDQVTGGATIPVVQNELTDTAPYVAGLAPTTAGLESVLKTTLAPTATESKINPITSKISELTGQFEQKPVDYQTELNKYGFQTNVNDLQNVNTQLAATKAAYDKYSVGLEGKTASASSIYGRQALAQRQSAVELGGLSSMAQALQGNVQMAQDIADKTIAIKYEPVEQEIANQKFQLDQVYSQLDREEKRKADALKTTLDERQRLIEDKKNTETQIYEIMTAAAKNGADSQTLQNILKSKDINQAVNNAGTFLATPITSSNGQVIGGTVLTDQAKLDKANNIISIVDEISNLNLGGVTGVIGGRITLTPNQILADSKIKQLTGLLTLDNMGVMKGVLSDSDIKIIKEASTSLKRTLSEKNFRAELQKIKDTSDRVVAGNEILTADPTRADELRMILNSSPSITGQELRQLYGLSSFNSVGGDTENSLGSLSSSYESGGNPAAIGYDKNGGYSYGTYQLTKGNISNFLSIAENIPTLSPIVKSLKTAKIGSDIFNNLWKKMATTDASSLKKAEEKYIESTHYEPQVKKLEQSGVPLSKYSNVLKQVIFSTAVQHGASTSIIANAYKSLKNILKREPNEKELIAKIYNDRWSNGANFKSSTEKVKQSVFKRFQDELKVALSKINIS